MMTHLLKGIVIGFSIAVPIGPIAVLCIRRTLAHGTIVGIISGLGAAIADAVYGLIAGFGLTTLSDLLLRYKSWLGIFGGAFLLYLGIRTFFSEPEAGTETSSVAERRYMRAFVSTLFLTLASPFTILTFIAIMAATGIAVGVGDYRSASTFVFGVFVGSAIWWVILCGAVGLLRSKIDASTMRKINQVSGFVITVLAVHILVEAALGVSLVDLLMKVCGFK
jgi:threonine/homoserine/homoserine lactone efflux protein